MTTSIHGTVAAGFEGVADAFRNAFASDAMGAALSIYRNGEAVVDLWGGVADARSGRAWEEDTTSVIFSCTKGLMSILAAQLVQEGRLDYDAPVAHYWPEFAAGGKDDVRVRHVLSHQAGLSAPRKDLTTEDILDWSVVTERLAAQEPLWPPGTGYAYHSLTHGWLVGELVRRVTGKSVSAAFAERIAGPLDADAWIGLPAAEEPRVAHLSLAPGNAAPAVTSPTDWLGRAATLGGALPPELIGPSTGFNDPRLHRAEIPGAGGIATARALARIWSATVWPTGGVQLLEPKTVARATQVQSAGAPVFEVPGPWSRWGMGFQLDSDTRHFVTSAGFGHDGAGGQVGFAEPALGLGFAFITNLMQGQGDERATSIIDALRASPAVASSNSGTATHA